MITHPAFEVDPWRLRESELSFELLPHTESLFALSNGHIGWRGNLDEGEPHGLPGSYLNGVYERRPLPYAEAGFGYPEVGESVINITNGKVIRLLVDDEPFDVRYGRLISHERCLELRDGVLRRHAEWQSPTGRRIAVRSTRLVSLTQRSIGAIHYEIEAVDGPARIVVQSELIANEQLPTGTLDPRSAAALANPLVSEQYDHDEHARAILVHVTRQSGLRVAAAMDHVVEGPGGMDTQIECTPDLARFTTAVLLEPGQKLRMVKFTAYGWSAERSLPAVRDQVAAAMVAARQTGWKRLLADQRAALDGFWARADVEIDGDPRIQQAARFALFHLYQTGARAEQRPLPAKGLTGNGYDGHAFWDTESFVLHALTYTAPECVGNALRWRHKTLDAARERAKQLDLRGASFPWRTISGMECSGYWPAGTAAVHINADIADAVIRYHSAAGDRHFEREAGFELLAETARLWATLGHYDEAGAFRIDGVTGPDEYSALCDNNVYTNLMAQQNLAAAADAVFADDARARALGISQAEGEQWAAAARAMYVPYDQARGVHPQADGFLEHAVWDFENTPESHYPLLLHHSYFDLYRKQVVKQADLVLALHLRGDAFTHEQKVRDFDYYEPLTVRDSSLSACTQSVVAAEVGYPALALAYLREAALMDIDDLEHNTADGLHMASLAGAWIGLVEGFGGMRHHRGAGMTFAPRLPDGWNSLAFRLVVRGRILSVRIGRDQARYELLEQTALDLSGGTSLGDCEVAASMDIKHYGEELTLEPGKAVELPIPALEHRQEPRQPAGRAPKLPAGDIGGQ